MNRVDDVRSRDVHREFLGFSYGFRPGRGAHDALDALAYGIEKRKVSWIVDADVRAYFDSISREWLVRFVEHRIDGVLRWRWHDDIWVVGRWLGRVVNGWLNYYAVPGSGRFLRGFVRRLLRMWHRALRRRSQRDRFAWKKIERMRELLWPPVTIRHPWPDRRFAVKHPR